MTGRVEEKLPNPMEGMTEEQKEYEAMKLVNMFDKLSRYQKRERSVRNCGLGMQWECTRRANIGQTLRLGGPRFVTES